MSKNKPTHRSTWKRREASAAALFGARRKPGSGSMGRDDETRSDSKHPRLFIETKLRAESAVWKLFLETQALAKKEGKTPVLCLAQKHKHGVLIVCHQADLDKVLAERVRVFAKGHDLEPLDGVLNATDWADLLESSEVLDGTAE